MSACPDASRGGRCGPYGRPCRLGPHSWGYQKKRKRWKRSVGAEAEAGRRRGRGACRIRKVAPKSWVLGRVTVGKSRDSPTSASSSVKWVSSPQPFRANVQVTGARGRWSPRPDHCSLWLIYERLPPAPCCSPEPCLAALHLCSSLGGLALSLPVDPSVWALGSVTQCHLLPGRASSRGRRQSTDATPRPSPGGLPSGTSLATLPARGWPPGEGAHRGKKGGQLLLRVSPVLPL